MNEPPTHSSAVRQDLRTLRLILVELCNRFDRFVERRFPITFDVLWIAGEVCEEILSGAWNTITGSNNLYD
mgnify:CR=1 FL=1